MSEYVYAVVMTRLLMQSRDREEVLAFYKSVGGKDDVDETILPTDKFVILRRREDVGQGLEGVLPEEPRSHKGAGRRVVPSKDGAHDGRGSREAQKKNKLQPKGASHRGSVRAAPRGSGEGRKRGKK